MANHSTVKDTGAFFTITPETREVRVPQTHKIIGVVGDHLAEQLTFEIPRIIDGHDIAGCSRRYVEWENVDGEIGADQLVELTELPEGAQEGMLYFTWTIRDKLAAAKGVVQFSIHFEDVDENGVRLYHWGTTNCKNCEILDSINHTTGTYAAIWVAGDTLVIEDYTPVDKNTLSLDMPGIVPEGTLEIRSAGLHDVGRYAAVNVVASGNMPSGTLEITTSGEHDVTTYAKAKVNFETPSIQVSNLGEISATANGETATYQLSNKDDSQLDPACIRNGETIFGVTGAYPRQCLIKFKVSVGGTLPLPLGPNHGLNVMGCRYADTDGAPVQPFYASGLPVTDFTLNVVEGTRLIIEPALGNHRLFFAPNAYEPGLVAGVSGSGVYNTPLELAVNGFSTGIEVYLTLSD